MMSTLTSLPTKGKIALGASALGIVLVAFLLVKMASAPSYTTALAGIQPAQTAKVTAALDAQGIAYELRNNGTAVAVEKSQLPQARVALASAGVDSNQQPGFELLDKQKLGTSDFQQKINYQRALEGEIARTINQVQGVSGAQVQLTLPQDTLFADQKKPATAAVLLGGTGPASLDPGAVRGIASLVSSSVEGLTPSNVTITDASGSLLWPTGQDGTSGATSKTAAEARYATDLESSLNAMLTRTLGPGKAQVQAHADLNVDQTTQDKLAYEKKGVPLKATTDVETLKGKGGGAGGGAGANANIPSYAAAGVSGGNSNYKHTTKSTDFGVGKVVTHTKVAPGSVNKLDVAVLVDKSVPPAQVAAIKTAVASAAGIQTARGDTLAVSQVAFAKQPTATAGGPLSGGILGYAKWALLGLASILFLFFAGRHLRRREGETIMDEPTWLRQIESPRPLSALEDAEATIRAAAVPRQQSPELAFAQPNRNAALVEEAIDRDPERVAQTLRSWLTEDGV